MTCIACKHYNEGKKFQFATLPHCHTFLEEFVSEQNEGPPRDEVSRNGKVPPLGDSLLLLLPDPSPNITDRNMYTI